MRRRRTTARLPGTTPSGKATITISNTAPAATSYHVPIETSWRTTKSIDAGNPTEAGDDGARDPADTPDGREYHGVDVAEEIELVEAQVRVSECDERAADGGERRRDCERVDLCPEDTDPHARGRSFVVAHGDQTATNAATTKVRHDKCGQDHECNCDRAVPLRMRH